VAIDYSRFQSGANPLQMAMQGFSDAGAIQQAQQQRAIGQQNYELNQMKIAEYQKAQAKKQQFQSAVTQLNEKEKPAAQDYQQLIANFPELGKIYDDTLSAMNEQQKQATITRATTAYSLLSAGNTDLAKTKIKEYADAAENVGDTAMADAFNVINDQIDMNPNGARDTAGMLLARTQGEKFGSTLESIYNMQRANELQPGAMVEQDMKMMQLGTTMGIAPKVTQDMLKSYRGAGLSSDAAMSLFAIEAGNPSGKIYDPDKRYAASKDLRTEYNKRVGDVTAGRINFEKMLESAKIGEGLGDVALITSFMKMLDPGSTVRESEFATARDTAGLYSSLENAANKAKTGEFLSSSQRGTFITLAKKYLAAAERDGSQTRKSMEGIVDRLGLNPADVFTDGQDSSLPANGTPPGATSGFRIVNRRSGTE